MALCITRLYFKAYISNKPLSLMTTYGHACTLTSVCQPKQQGVLAAEILREVTDETAARKKQSTLGFRGA